MQAMRRYWDDAREKVEREGRCRACGSPVRVQFAHTVGRVHDERIDYAGETVIYVDPDDGIPLCETHHLEYDARRLSILEHLTQREQAAAVCHLGIVRAYARLTSARDAHIVHVVPDR